LSDLIRNRKDKGIYVMSFDNLRLRSKNLIPLGAMVAITLAVLAFGMLTLFRVSGEAGEIIEKRDVAIVKLMRATRYISQTTFDLSEGLVVEEDSPVGRALAADFKAALLNVSTLMDAAAVFLPDHADEIHIFNKRFAEYYTQVTPLFDASFAAPSLERGHRLKPEEVDALADFAKKGEPFALTAKTLIDDMVVLNNRIIAENAMKAQGLRENSHDAILKLGIAGLVSAALAVAFALWVTMFKIERPLIRLGAKMRDLAGGDLAVKLEETGRRDEIGDMARAVEVFKTNALERQRAENDATAARVAVETERAAGSAERARLTQAQTAAMGALRTGLRRLADGNLTARLTDGFTGEFADVRDDYNAAADKLRGALGLVVRSTGSIQTSSMEISSASDNLSQRTEQQAASLEETAAALEEITNTLRASADNAQHAASVVANADTDAKKGAVVVRQAVEAMDAIAASSHKIGQIIGVIDEIAFQTNLLALNAGVEAARAGDSGKGFAVVAMEVRALAELSAEAAKEIKALVSASGAQVHSGVKLVAETGKALESIITQVSEINKVVGEIAEAARQQATGVAEINTAISQMDQTTQQNATMVEESTAASHALSRETSELTRLVEQFRLAEPGDEDLRRNLKSVAPHAFAPRAAPPARVKAGPGPRLARNSGGGDWTEF
jgi:methyl-accepting chemotaxis protein